MSCLTPSTQLGRLWAERSSLITILRQQPPSISPHWPAVFFFTAIIIIWHYIKHRSIHWIICLSLAFLFIYYLSSPWQYKLYEGTGFGCLLYHWALCLACNRLSINTDKAKQSSLDNYLSRVSVIDAVPAFMMLTVEMENKRLLFFKHSGESYFACGLKGSL